MGHWMKTRLVVSSRKTWPIYLTTLMSLIVLPALALAHGGMGPDEVGPPIGTASLVGFVSYWVVMLWPSSKKKGGAQVGPNGQRTSASETVTYVRTKKTPRVKRIPHLRKIEAGTQFSSDQSERRKASDG
jgi:hypothetical protein